MTHHADAVVRVTKRPVRYSPDELKLLAKLTNQARELLKQEDKMNLFMEKSVWIHIANHMHAMGFPKRSWVVLRTKGTRALIASGPERHTAVVSPTTSQHLSQASTVDTVCVTSNNTQHPRTQGALVSYCSAQCFTPASSLSYAYPPPLIPSSEASATTLLALANHGCLMSTSVNSTSPTITPQIVNVRSTALPTSLSNQPNPSIPHSSREDDFHVTSTVPMSLNSSNSSNQPTTPSNLLRSLGADHQCHIHLSVSSDEDELPTVTCNSRETTVSSPCTVPCVTAECQNGTEKNSQEDLLNPQLQIQIYRKKLEVLEIKKIYWMEKLKRLQQQQGEDVTELSKL